MARIMCIDPENSNNFLILTEGKAEIYRDVNGVARLFSPLQQIRAGTMAADGNAHSLSGRYDSKPAVFVVPSGLKTYDGTCRYIGQQAEVGDVFVNSLGDGKYEAGVTGGAKLKIPAAQNVFYPVYDVREQQYRLGTADFSEDLIASFGEKTYGPYYIPGITWAKSALTGVVLGPYQCISGWSVPPRGATIRETDISFSVGISGGTSKPTSWGTTTLRAPYTQTVPTFVVEAETTGAGNYLWFRVALSVPTQVLTHLSDRQISGGAEYTTVGPYPLAGFISYGVAGANVTYSGTDLFSGGSAAIVEVG